jgi:hypothetical protein
MREGCRKRVVAGQAAPFFCSTISNSPLICKNYITIAALRRSFPQRRQQLAAGGWNFTHLRDKLGLFSILFAMVSKAEVAEDNSNSLVFRSKGDGPVARWEPQCGIRRPNLYA